jgi:hypothetical protein
MRALEFLKEFSSLGPNQVPMGQPAQQPPVQNIPPTPNLQKPQQTAQLASVKQELIDLVDKVEDFPDNATSKQYTIELLKKIANYRPMNTVAETDQHPVPVSRDENLQNLLKAALQNLTPEMINAIAKSVQRGEKLSDADASKFSTELAKGKDVKKAATSYEKTIELDTKGEIVQMDTELENYAAGIAKKLGLDLKWARNLVGMFGVNINREDRIEFLKLCGQHKALNIGKMLKDKHGKLSDLITKSPPSIREVFQHVKGTLLDISLSTGQRDATGPFEAMLCIMGGAIKLSEKGDVRIGNKNYEVKGSSITVSKTGGAGMSKAWLEATKMKGGALKGHFFKILANYIPSNKFSKNFTALVEASDFRAENIGFLRNVLDSIPAKSKSEKDAKKLDVITQLHVLVFPTLSAETSIKGYNFNKEMQKIVSYINDEDYQNIAKIQGVMGILEYYLNDYQSGMIFYNSSLETYRVLSDINDILEMAKNPSAFGIHFAGNSITMGVKNDKAGPGVYFGSESSSPEAMSYINTRRKEMGINKDFKPRNKTVN